MTIMKQTLKCDEDGNSLYDIVTQNEDNYGAMDVHETIYNQLNYGLPRDDYLIYHQYSIVAINGPPSISLYINKNAQEPILRYGNTVIKIEIDVKQQSQNGDIVAQAEKTIDDNSIIAKLVEIRNRGETLFWDDSKYISSSQNVSFIVIGWKSENGT